MIALAGIIIVIVSIVGGFLMEKGNLSVLFQPAELVIIGGAAVGSFVISSPRKIIWQVLKSFPSIIIAKSPGKQSYLDILSLLYRLFSKIRKEGLVSIESDIESPEKSPLFSRHAGILSNRNALNFICDNLKVIISTNVVPHELDSLMDLEIETFYREAMIPSRSIGKIADGLPGLGIVAAVLGVVLTMEKIDQPPAVLGHSIGAALVGTFLGVLLCYGFVGPMAANLEHQAHEDEIFLQVIKGAIVAFVGGAPPQIAVEFARRAIPGGEKPTFGELERAVRGTK